MSHSYEELRKKSVAQLREIAAGLDHAAVRGYTQMNKEHLLGAVCSALGVEMHEHHDVVGLDKTNVKAEIRKLKRRRDEALASRNRADVKASRRRIHRLKHMLHKATV